MKNFKCILVSILCITFFVSFDLNALAQDAPLEEKEPNNIVANAQMIKPNRLLKGSMSEGDFDIYKFELEEESSVGFYFAQEYPLGSVGLFDKDEVIIDFVYDRSSKVSNLNFSNLPKGLYYIVVFESATTESPNNQYELKVTVKDEKNRPPALSFSDVDSSHYAYQEIAWAKEEGIVNGYENGKFGPNNKVTEAQFAKMLANYFNLKTVNNRVNKNTANEVWSDDFYHSLAAYGVPLNGYFENPIRNKPIKRGLVAQALAYLSYDQLDVTDSIQFLLDHQISVGQNLESENNVLKFFGYTNELSRSQAVLFLYRMNNTFTRTISEKAYYNYQNDLDYSLDELAKQAIRKVDEDLKDIPVEKPKEPVKPVDLTKLQGMYYGFEMDYDGFKCGGLCWKFYTFLPGNKIVIGEPLSGGPEAIDCKKDNCLSYSLKSDKLVLSNGKSLSIGHNKNGLLVIDSVRLEPVKPVPNNLKLNGKYTTSGYYGLVGINPVARSWVKFITFNSNGTFETDYFWRQLPIPDESTSATGTYTINGNTITLTYSDGRVTREVFYGEPNSNGVYKELQIGDRSFDLK